MPAGLQDTATLGNTSGCPALLLEPQWALLQQSTPNPRRGARASWEVTNREVIHRYELSHRGREIIHMHRQGVLTCEVGVKEGEARFIDESFPWTPMDLPPPACVLVGP